MTISPFVFFHEINFEIFTHFPHACLLFNKYSIETNFTHQLRLYSVEHHRQKWITLEASTRRRKGKSTDACFRPQFAIECVSMKWKIIEQRIENAFCVMMETTTIRQVHHRRCVDDTLNCQFNLLMIHGSISFSQFPFPHENSVDWKEWSDKSLIGKL